MHLLYIEIVEKIISVTVVSVFLVLGILSVFKTKTMYEYFYQSYLNGMNRYRNIPVLNFIYELNLNIFEKTGYVFLKIWGVSAIIFSILGIFGILFGPIQL